MRRYNSYAFIADRHERLEEHRNQSGILPADEVPAAIVAARIASAGRVSSNAR
jgi:hypothetical protein